MWKLLGSLVAQALDLRYRVGFEIIALLIRYGWFNSVTNVAMCTLVLLSLASSTSTSHPILVGHLLSRSSIGEDKRSSNAAYIFHYILVECSSAIIT